MSHSLELLLLFLILTGPVQAQFQDAAAFLGQYLKMWPLFHQEACYGALGCFDNKYPFSSPWRLVDRLPEPEETIGTNFLLYTRAMLNVTTAEELRAGDEERLKRSKFQGSKNTTLIVHGFTHDGRRPWIQALVQELLNNDDGGVIVVDWGRGAKWPYMQAVANARLVGAQISQFIQFLVEAGKASVDRIHIIGHSLGAHVAGYAGERLSSLGRITGLDPANIFFETSSSVLRLDPSDAKFVDVIHTDAGTGGFGLVDRLGHADFYPNGGANQPGCEDKFANILDSLQDGSVTQLKEADVIDDFVCSHNRAFLYYIESINSPCPWLAARCTSWTDFTVGACRRCNQAMDCMPLGHHAAKPVHPPQAYYLKTTSASPFCKHNYRIEMKISSLQKNPTRGHIYVTITGQNATLPEEEITFFRPQYKGPQTIVAKETLNHVFDGALSIGQVQGVSVRYVAEMLYIQSWFYETWVHIDSVVIATLDENGAELRFPFCGGILNTTVTYKLQPKNDGC